MSRPTGRRPSRAASPGSTCRARSVQLHSGQHVHAWLLHGCPWWLHITVDAHEDFSGANEVTATVTATATGQPIPFARVGGNLVGQWGPVGGQPRRVARARLLGGGRARGRSSVVCHDQTGLLRPDEGCGSDGQISPRVSSDPWTRWLVALQRFTVRCLLALATAIGVALLMAAVTSSRPTQVADLRLHLCGCMTIGVRRTRGYIRSATEGLAASFTHGSS